MKYPDLCPHCLELGMQHTGGVIGTTTFSIRLRCHGPDKHTFCIKRPDRVKAYNVREYFVPAPPKNPVPRREPRPFVELRRDPFEFMKLALSIKRP